MTLVFREGIDRGGCKTRTTNELERTTKTLEEEGMEKRRYAPDPSLTAWRC